ncbi:MAG: hypothetical protein LBL86_05265, partial [Coriobacteriales bacterium]|nr:hypothetical protein [Coriobacteriales bacterium]
PFGCAQGRLRGEAPQPRDLWPRSGQRQERRGEAPQPRDPWPRSGQRQVEGFFDLRSTACAVEDPSAGSG